MSSKEWDYPGDMGLPGPYPDHERAISRDVTFPVGKHGTTIRVCISAHRKLFYETDIQGNCDRCSALTPFLFMRDLPAEEQEEDCYFRLCDTCVGIEVLIKELSG